MKASLNSVLSLGEIFHALCLTFSFPKTISLLLRKYLHNLPSIKYNLAFHLVVLGMLVITAGILAGMIAGIEANPASRETFHLQYGILIDYLHVYMPDFL